MTYDDFRDWASVASEAKRQTRDVIRQLVRARDAYDFWVTYAGARSDATIASNEGGGVTTADVTAMRDLYTALGDMFDYANNVDPTGNTVDRRDKYDAVRLSTANWTTKVILTLALGRAETLQNTLADADISYQRYWNWRNGRTDATVATDIGAPATTGSCQGLRLCNAAFNEMWGFWTGSAGTQRNYLADMMKFLD